MNVASPQSTPFGVKSSAGHVDHGLDEIDLVRSERFVSKGRRGLLLGTGRLAALLRACSDGGDGASRSDPRHQLGHQGACTRDGRFTLEEGTTSKLHGFYISHRSISQIPHLLNARRCLAADGSLLGARCSYLAPYSSCPLLRGFFRILRKPSGL